MAYLVVNFHQRYVHFCKIMTTTLQQDDGKQRQCDENTMAMCQHRNLSCWYCACNTFCDAEKGIGDANKASGDARRRLSMLGQVWRCQDYIWGCKEDDWERSSQCIPNSTKYVSNVRSIFLSWPYAHFYYLHLLPFQMCWQHCWPVYWWLLIYSQHAFCLSFLRETWNVKEGDFFFLTWQKSCKFGVNGCDCLHVSPMLTCISYNVCIWLYSCSNFCSSPLHWWYTN